MNPLRAWPVIVAALASASAVGAQESPYSAYRDREIKALAPEEVAGLLRGDGMHMALSAELNGYPGPRHALELADSLDLTAEQRTQTREVYDRMRAAAVDLGQKIVAGEAALDSLFRSGSPDPDDVERRTIAIGQTMGRLRAAHLLAHLRLRAILTPGQISAYNRLRGYGAANSAQHRHIHE